MASAKHTSAQQKFKVLNKLFDAGYLTKTDLNNLDMEAMLKIEGITIPDMTVIIEIIKNVKKGRLYEYLGGEIEKEDTKE